MGRRWLIYLDPLTKDGHVGFSYPRVERTTNADLAGESRNGVVGLLLRLYLFYKIKVQSMLLEMDTIDLT